MQYLAISCLFFRNHVFSSHVLWALIFKSADMCSCWVGCKSTRDSGSDRLETSRFPTLWCMHFLLQNQNIPDFLRGLPCRDSKNFSKFSADSGPKSSGKRAPIYMPTTDHPSEQGGSVVLHLLLLSAAVNPDRCGTLWYNTRTHCRDQLPSIKFMRRNVNKCEERLKR